MQPQPGAPWRLPFLHVLGIPWAAHVLLCGVLVGQVLSFSLIWISDPPRPSSLGPYSGRGRGGSSSSISSRRWQGMLRMNLGGAPGLEGNESFGVLQGLQSLDSPRTYVALQSAVSALSLVADKFVYWDGFQVLADTEQQTGNISSLNSCNTINRDFQKVMQECFSLINAYDLVVRQTGQEGDIGKHRSGVIKSLADKCGLTQADVARGSLHRFSSRRSAATCAAGSITPTANSAKPGKPQGSFSCGLGGFQENRVLPETFDTAFVQEQRHLSTNSSGAKIMNNIGTPAAHPERNSRMSASWGIWRRWSPAYPGAAPLRQKEQDYLSNATAVPASAISRPRVSFMLQYYMQPRNLNQSVFSYARCLPGTEGTPNPSNITMELLVNVDQPKEAHVWAYHWRTLQEEREEAVVPDSDAPQSNWFLFIIFQHNIHENRGFNALASAARGEVLMQVQDDDYAPVVCEWLQNMIGQFDAHPRVAAVGYQTGVKLWVPSRRYVLQYWPWDRLHFETDRTTGTAANFDHLVDLGPLATMRCVWHSMGGWDESWGALGETGIVSDWAFSHNLWLAGYQAMHVWAKHGKGIGTELGTTHVQASLSAAVRWRNVNINMELLKGMFNQSLEFVGGEVKRSFYVLSTLEPWFA